MADRRPNRAPSLLVLPRRLSITYPASLITRHLTFVRDWTLAPSSTKGNDLMVRNDAQRQDASWVSEVFLRTIACK